MTACLAASECMTLAALSASARRNLASRMTSRSEKPVSGRWPLVSASSNEGAWYCCAKTLAVRWSRRDFACSIASRYGTYTGVYTDKAWNIRYDLVCRPMHIVHSSMHVPALRDARAFPGARAAPLPTSPMIPPCIHTYTCIRI